jgi:hypothetical protein
VAKARLRRAWKPLAAVVASFLASVAFVTSALGYWDLARTWRERVPQGAVVLDFLASTRGSALLVFVFLVSLAWMYKAAVNPGGRAAARRLHTLGKFGIQMILNEKTLSAADLTARYRAWNARVLEAMRDEGCSETEIAEFEMLGVVAPIATPGPTADHRHIQQLANTKVERLRRAAARFEHPNR